VRTLKWDMPMWHCSLPLSSKKYAEARRVFLWAPLAKLARPWAAKPVVRGLCSCGEWGPASVYISSPAALASSADVVS
jgi:hypothetical protein